MFLNAIVCFCMPMHVCIFHGVLVSVFVVVCALRSVRFSLCICMRIIEGAAFHVNVTCTRMHVACTLTGNGLTGWGGWTGLLTSSCTLSESRWNL